MGSAERHAWPYTPPESAEWPTTTASNRALGVSASRVASAPGAIWVASSLPPILRAAGLLLLTPHERHSRAHGSGAARVSDACSPAAVALRPRTLVGSSSRRASSSSPARAYRRPPRTCAIFSVTAQRVRANAARSTGVTPTPSTARRSASAGLVIATNSALSFRPKTATNMRILKP